MRVDDFTPGTFCWHELGTTDDARAKAFYEQLFGWSITPSELTEGADSAPDDGCEDMAGMTYWMLRHEGRDVGGAYVLPEPMRAQGIPPFWLSYIGVESCDEAAKRAGELGGTVQAGPLDVFDIGRMAMITDPAGATFAVWEAKKHRGQGVAREVGSVCWNELMTHEPEKASAFYADLFGWKADKQEIGPIEYTLMMRGEEPVCGVMQLPPEAGEAPPSWMVYFQVGDADEEVAHAQELGATVCGPLQDVPTVGRMAVLQDPTGAAFALIRLDQPS